MNTGVYGTVRAANINPGQDVEIFYYYKPTRGTDSVDFLNGYKQLDAETCLVQAKFNDGVNENGTDLIGMFDLKLPLDKFSSKGIYTVYIRPKEYTDVLLSDVSTLYGFDDIKGIIINLSSNGQLAGISDLTGYRVEYIDEYGNRDKDTARIITSCNYVEPINVNGNEVKYNIISDTSSSLLFCTVTPSTANSFAPNSVPFIGTAGGRVVLINTKFNPTMLEIEMVEKDLDTISTMLEGDQVRDRDKGLLTTYDDTKSIYQQYELYTLKDKLNHPLYDVKRKKEVPDMTQAWEKIIVSND